MWLRGSLFRSAVDGERRNDHHLLVHVVGIRDDDAVFACGAFVEGQTVGAFAVFLGCEPQVVHRVGVHRERPDGRDHRRPVFLGALHAEDAHDGHGVGLVVLGADDEGERLSGFEPYSGPAAFDDYFCLGFAGCESGDVDAGARSHPHVVFFELLGRAVGEYADDLTLEFGFEGLRRYRSPPPESWPLRPSGIGFFSSSY